MKLLLLLSLLRPKQVVRTTGEVGGSVDEVSGTGVASKRLVSDDPIILLSDGTHSARW